MKLYLGGKCLLVLISINMIFRYLHYKRIINFSLNISSVWNFEIITHLVSRSKTGVIIAEMRAVADLHISRVERNDEERWGALITTGIHRQGVISRLDVYRRAADWRSTRRCSINWRITFLLGGQCHLQKTVLHAARTPFDMCYGAKLQKTKRKKRKERERESEKERRWWKARKTQEFARLENKRGERNEPIKVQSSCTPGAPGCRDVTCGHVYTVSPRRANNIC